MRILQVNHGYPPRYNAGSEVYCRTVTRALVERGHDVAVFTREEDPYRPDYALRVEQDDKVPVHLANMPRTQHRYQHDALDEVFRRVLASLRPEVVHIHHLNHLSTSLPSVARASGAGVVFTVHDFWLACPRGQRVQWSLGGEPWPLCPGQDDHRCATACYARCHGGADIDVDVAYWSAWTATRMRVVEAQLDAIDRFLCPSRTVADALAERFPAVADRLDLVDYGFPPLRRARRVPGPFTFGYVGTHAPPKGVDLLVRAFAEVRGDVRLRIWGRTRGQETDALRRLAEPDPRVSFEGEYQNENIAGVFDQVDAIVVPSVWLENSPLVIHEAQQARVCVVTADAGGMAEYVAHEVNGLLFRHRHAGDLSRQLQRLVQEPGLAQRLGARGYLHRPDGDPVPMAEQVVAMENLYREVCRA